VLQSLALLVTNNFIRRFYNANKHNYNNKLTTRFSISCRFSAEMSVRECPKIGSAVRHGDINRGRRRLQHHSQQQARPGETPTRRSFHPHTPSDIIACVSSSTHPLKPVCSSLAHLRHTQLIFILLRR
jgi:hypothetical protein